MSDKQKVYKLELDIVQRTLYVVLDADLAVEDTVDSADGMSSVDFRLANDDLPYVLGVTIRDPNRVTVVQDWIEEAIDGALTFLNVGKKEDYGNNYWKGGGSDSVRALRSGE